MNFRHQTGGTQEKFKKISDFNLRLKTKNKDFLTILIMTIKKSLLNLKQ
ncbi:hypothetical protein [Mesomycoplasma ovipneumoniae]|nr:hypothetical protein [Mesomycoplasma ovipneumoniae]